MGVGEIADTKTYPDIVLEFNPCPWRAKMQIEPD
jgi:hypothetical protein